MLATAYSFDLSGFLKLGSPPAEISWGLGTRAGGQLVAAAGAVIAAVAFFTSNGRRKRGEPWAARREGSLGTAAIVFGAGFLVTSVGLMLLASQINGDGRSEAEYWLQAAAQLLLAVAAACGAVGFLLSRRDAERRADFFGRSGAGRLEDGDGPDLAASPMRGRRSGTSSSEIVLVTKRARSIRPSSAACARKGKSSRGIVSPPCVTAIVSLGPKSRRRGRRRASRPGTGMPTSVAVPA